jgi:hypothetical protein
VLEKDGGMSKVHKQRGATNHASAKGPSAILALQHELRGRLVSTGGRPSDPTPTIRRLVTVKKQVWKELQRQATVLSRLGRHVSPGQLAAILLEQRVSRLGLR